MTDLIGIKPKTIGEDIVLGLGIGVLFIIANILSPVASIGIPRLPLGIAEDGLVVMVVAPLVEELLFRGVFLAIAFLIFYAMMKDKLISIILAILVVSVAFSVFHMSVYGIAMEMAYIGAASFSVLACVVAVMRKSLVAPIVLHSMVNTYLFIQAYSLLTIG